ncbi:MAG: CRTAC1 family protein [Candidatus Poribacteria bacterium]|nr:CRTAC1 family protein [Candidatus Poribacteria bacterium]
MTGLARFFLRYIKQIVAIVLIVVLYGFTRLPELSEVERTHLAARFRFTKKRVPELPGKSHQLVRAVHPSLEHIKAWVSSVGASVALGDLDRDGLPNDVCYVDTRTDQVIVAQVEITPVRYKPFALDPAPLPYDPATTAPMGTLLGDLNEDGLMDVLVYYWGRTPVIFLRKQESASSLKCLNALSFVRREFVPKVERWNTNAATLADLDGDGHVDVIIGNYFRDGDRILDSHATDSVQMQHSMSRAFNAGTNRLFLWTEATAGNQPTVHFWEARGVLDKQVSQGWTLAVGAADLDGDLLPEIYFAHDFGPDRLMHNCSTQGELKFVRLDGKKQFTTPNSKVLGRDSFKGMGVDFGDLNGDGWLDIYVSNIADEYALEESHFAFLSTGEVDLMKKGIAPYVDCSEPLGLSRSGWGWESRLGDFDNDGVLEALQATGFVKGEVNRWPELHELAMGNDELLSYPKSWPRLQPGDDLSGKQHNPFFARAKDGRYYDLAHELDLDESMVTRGIATADVDGDGDLDFVYANQWEPSVFIRNDSPNPGAFLGLHLLLPLQKEYASKTFARSGHPETDTYGRPAIGTAVTVYLPDGRQLVGQVDGGNGHSGVRSPALHFGLGHLSDDTKLRVEMHWRDTSGRVCRDTLHLLPGWYTVLLGTEVK